LFTVLSLFTLYLFLAGSAASTIRGGPARDLTGIALSIAAGILLNFCLTLTGQPLSRVLAAGVFVAAIGAVQLFRRVRTRTSSEPDAVSSPTVAWIASALLLVLYYVVILGEPLLHWDARAIWFFHARMIWIGGALTRTAGWTHPSVAFSNPDYPKLVPALAAQLAHVKGYWNDFFPKGSLLIILVPLTLWVFSFWRARPSFLLLVLAFFFSLEAWLWNGYMDGFLALYAGVALLLLGRYVDERRSVDLYSAIAAAGIAANLKNEGLLFVVSLMAAVAAAAGGSVALRLSRFATRVRTDALFVLVAVLSIAPTILWSVSKKAWGLQNDLTRSPLDSVARFSTRLFDGESAKYVLRYLATEASAIWWLSGLVVAAGAFSLLKRNRLPRGAVIAAATGGLYTLGLYVVYLSTPHDILEFYLSTSAVRTMTTASMSLLVALFFLISEIEGGTAGPPHKPTGIMIVA
jgi:hypothetical protein